MKRPVILTLSERPAAMVEQLRSGMFRVYANVEESEEKISSRKNPDDPESEETDTVNKVFLCEVVDVPVLDYDAVVSALVRSRYSENDVEAILMNHADGNAEHEAQYAALQQFRVQAKKVARAALNIPDDLEYVKAEKLAELNEYDNSTAVNGFSYQGNVMWLKFNKRKDVRAGVDAMIASGHGDEEYELWDGGVCISIPAFLLSSMLNAIEVYALKCYAVTARHEANVSALGDMEAVKAYDFTVGYPEQLKF